MLMLVQAQLKLKGESCYKHQCEQWLHKKVPVHSLIPEKMHLFFPLEPKGHSPYAKIPERKQKNSPKFFTG